MQAMCIWLYMYVASIWTCILILDTVNMIPHIEDEDVRKHAMYVFSTLISMNGSQEVVDFFQFQEYLAAGVGEERPGTLCANGAAGKRV